MLLLHTSRNDYRQSLLGKLKHAPYPVEKMLHIVGNFTLWRIKGSLVNNYNRITDGGQTRTMSSP